MNMTHSPLRYKASAAWSFFDPFHPVIPGLKYTAEIFRVQAHLNALRAVPQSKRDGNMNRILTFCILLGIWLVFSGLFDAFHLTLGVLSAALVTAFSADLLFADSKRAPLERMREAGRFAGYSVWLLGQIFLANFMVLRLALLPGGLQMVQPELVPFRTKLRSDFAKWVLANSITLTPGTVTIKMQGDQLLVHAINPAAARGLGGEMEQRIARVYQSVESQG